ncbi:MAG: hypothetical protein L0Y64_02645, partial [Myxococcaceae bacterium]|nr:hypothetical protein [Myxococcaceae bacterium]
TKSATQLREHDDEALKELAASLVRLCLNELENPQRISKAGRPMAESRALARRGAASAFDGDEGRV